MNAEIFKKNSFIKNERLKKELLEIKEEKCERCGVVYWQNQKIHLQLHHIDGDNSNNELGNLQLLCPNCHSLTDNFCGKRNGGSRKRYSEEEICYALKNNKSILAALHSLGMNSGRNNYARCREIIQKYTITHLLPMAPTIEEKRCSKCGVIIGNCKTGLCANCYSFSNRVAERPSREQLKKEIRSNSFLSLGKKYDVSDNAIRKWCKAYQLPQKTKEIKQYSDKEWELI